jgi:hypothetical protein
MTAPLAILPVPAAPVPVVPAVPPWEPVSPPEPLPVFNAVEDGILRPRPPAPRHAVTEPRQAPPALTVAPVIVPEPEPEPEPERAVTPDDRRVRGMLEAKLYEAFKGRLDLDGEKCPDCEAGNGLCEWDSFRADRALEYERLHDFAAVTARSDAEAVAEVVAAIRAGSADRGDIAWPGSPLDLILTEALADAGARVERMSAEAGAR